MEVFGLILQDGAVARSVDDHGRLFPLSKTRRGNDVAATMVRGKIGVNVGHVCSSSLGGIEFAERRGVFSDPRATMTNFLLSHRDCVILAAGAVLVFAVLHRWLWRERTKGVVVPVMWVIVLTVLGGRLVARRGRGPAGARPAAADGGRLRTYLRAGVGGGEALTEGEPVDQ